MDADEDHLGFVVGLFLNCVNICRYLCQLLGRFYSRTAVPALYVDCQLLGILDISADVLNLVLF